MLPTIVSGYSSDPYYVKSYDIFSRMTASIQNKILIKPFEHRGNWHDNTRMKPEIILEFLLQEKSPVMWIDIDAEVYKTVDLDIPNNIDMMGIKQEWGPRRNWCVGTILFNYTENAIGILEDWINSCRTSGGTDEAHLEKIWVEKWHNKCNTAILDNKFFIMEKIHFKDYNTVIMHKSSGNARKKVPVR